MKMPIGNKWSERCAKAEADLAIGAGFAIVNPTDADAAQMEALAELLSLPQWAQDELMRLRTALATPQPRAMGSRQVSLEPYHLNEFVAGHVSCLGDAELTDEGNQPKIGSQLDGKMRALDHCGSPFAAKDSMSIDHGLPREYEGAGARIFELERAVGASVIATWLDMTTNDLRFEDIETNSASSMIFAAAGFDPMRDDIVAFRNAYMARFKPKLEGDEMSFPASSMIISGDQINE